MINYLPRSGKSARRAAAFIAVLTGLAPGLKLQGKPPDPSPTAEASPEMTEAEQAEATDNLITVIQQYRVTEKFFNKMESFMRSMTADRATKEEWKAMLTLQRANKPVRDSQFPKVLAAFNALEPETFENFSSAMAALSFAGIWVDSPFFGGKYAGTDDTVQANLDFWEAHRERCQALVKTWGDFSKSNQPDPVAAPAP